MSVVEKVARRRAWLAGLLQFVMPGLGNLYSGRPLRGLILFLSTQLVWIMTLVVFARTTRPLNLLIGVVGLFGIWGFVVVDSVRCAWSANPEYRLARYNRWYVYILAVVLVSLANTYLLAAPVRAYVAQSFKTPTPSMEPTLLVGEHLIADMTSYMLSAPERGDIVVFRAKEGTTQLKRIIGLPGETIEIRDRIVRINGNDLVEAYVEFRRPQREGKFVGDAMELTRVPDDAYFLLGDNRDNSLDSRFIGPIKRKDILGKVKAIYLSWDSETGSVRWDRLGKVVQ